MRRLWAVVVVALTLGLIGASPIEAATVPSLCACRDIGFKTIRSYPGGHIDNYDGDTGGARIGQYTGVVIYVADKYAAGEVVFRSYGRALDVLTGSVTDGGTVKHFGDGSFEVRWPGVRTGARDPIAFTLAVRDDAGYAWATPMQKIVARVVGGRCLADLDMQPDW